MALFTLIIIAWAIGIGGLIFWQTSKSKEIKKTEASYSEREYETPATKHSQFGELLQK